MLLSEEQKQIINNFFKDKPVHRAYVFGSYARGDATEQSDIDLLIDWDYSQSKGWAYVSAWRNLKEQLKKDVDFVSLRWMHPSLEKEINQNKLLIYERKAG